MKGGGEGGRGGGAGGRGALERGGNQEDIDGDERVVLDEVRQLLRRQAAVIHELRLRLQLVQHLLHDTTQTGTRDHAIGHMTRCEEAPTMTRAGATRLKQESLQRLCAQCVLV
jgi:hypothetical protein